MKKIFKMFLMFFAIFFVSTLTAKASEEGPFYFDWDNNLIGADLPSDIENSDNIGYKDGVVTAKSVYRSEGYLQFERYDINGKVIYKKQIEESWFFSMITDNEYIYAVVVNDYANAPINLGATTSNKIPLNKIIKLNEKLEIVAELPFDLETEPGSDGMVNARRFGHDILSLEDGYLYVYSGETYMLRTKTDLSKWETLDFTEELSAKHFPDLTKEYELAAKWGEELNNGNYLIDYLVTTHVYDEYYLTSGMKYTTTKPVGIFKLYDKNDKLIVEKTNENYSKFIQGRVIKNYIVVIGLIWDENFQTTASDILIYDMEGNLVQTISKGNIYHMLNETSTGFVVTNIEGNCETAPGDAGSSNAKFDSKNYCMKNNNETYYLKYNIKTEVIGKGNVEVIETSKNGESVTFVVTPEKGYVLGEVKVTDKKGNVVIFTDYTFTMPSSDVTIEAKFVVEKIEEEKNPDTSDILVVFFVITSIISIGLVINNKKKLDWIK